MKIRKYQTSLLSSCTFLLRGLKHFKVIGIHSHHWQVPLSSRTAKLPLLSFLRGTEQTKCKAIWKLPCLRWSLLEDRTRVGLTFVPFIPDGNYISVFLCCYMEGKKTGPHCKPEARVVVPTLLCVLEQINLRFWLWIFFFIIILRR